MFARKRSASGRLLLIVVAPPEYVTSTVVPVRQRGGLGHPAELGLHLS